MRRRAGSLAMPGAERAARRSRLALLAVSLVCAAHVARLLLSNAGAAEIRLGRIERATLDNGLRVIAMEYRKLPLVSVTLFLPAGAVHDPPGEEGLASLTVRLLRQGTSERGAEALALAIESLGGELSSSAGLDAASLSGSFLAKDIDAGLALMTEVLLHPAFDGEEARKLRSETLAAIRSVGEDPAALVARCYPQWVYGAHPYGRPVDGTEESVPRLEVAHVKQFYGRHFVAERAVVAIVGDLPAAELIGRARWAFAGLPAASPIEPARAEGSATAAVVAPKPVQGRPILLVDLPEATQTHIRIGNIALSRGDPDYIAAQVTSSVLGGGFTSRLVDQLRVKRHLSYSAWSEFDASLAGGDFNAGTFTRTASALEAIEVLRSVLREFATGSVAGDELARTEAYLVGQYPLHLETPEALGEKLAESAYYALPDDDIATWMDRVGGVSSADVQRLAARYVPTDAFAMVVVGRANELRAGLAKLGTVTEITAKRGCDGVGSRGSLRSGLPTR